MLKMFKNISQSLTLSLQIKEALEKLIKFYEILFKNAD